MSDNMLLKYPGSKMTAARDILDFFAPHEFTEFRDPCCGGCPWLTHLPVGMPRWINDLDEWVYRYWLALRDDPTFVDRFQEERAKTIGCLPKIEARFLEGRYRLRRGIFDAVDYLFLRRNAHLQLLNMPRRNVASFSPHMREVGLHPMTRERMENAKQTVQGVKMTCLDYWEVLSPPTDGVVFAICDPPYNLRYCQSRIYQHDWDIDDHVLLRDRVASLNPKTHKVLITLDAEDITRTIWEGQPGFTVLVREQTYGMKSDDDRQGNDELIIVNYPL